MHVVDCLDGVLEQTLRIRVDGARQQVAAFVSGGRCAGPVWLSLKVFVRPTCNTMRVHELSELLHQTFHIQAIPIVDSSILPPTTIGMLRLREAEVRDLTSGRAEKQRRPLHHAVVIVRDVAQSP